MGVPGPTPGPTTSRQGRQGATRSESDRARKNDVDEMVAIRQMRRKTVDEDGGRYAAVIGEPALTAPMPSRSAHRQQLLHVRKECVEVAGTADGGRAVRDAKARDRGTQFHSRSGWAAFIASIKSGALDAC